MNFNFLDIFILIISLEFLISRILDFLNYSHLSPELPKGLKSYFDEEYYKKSQSYEKSKNAFSMVQSLLGFAIILGMLLAGGFGYFDRLAGSITKNEILQGIVFFGFIGLGSILISLPFQYYFTFKIEEKYGFNKSSKLLFFTDQLKSMLLGIILGGFLYYIIAWFYQHQTDNFWWIAWLILSSFILFFTLFYSNLIVPLFSKQSPLEEGELREAIQKFALSCDFAIHNIYVIDGSKRSSKANAYFTGFGPKKRIVLYDTLIKSLSTEELVAVLAHEIGHYKKHHVLKAIVASILQMGILLYIISVFIDPTNPISFAAAKALDCQNSFHIGLLSFALLYSPVSFVVELMMNYFSRRNEFQADKFAGDQYDSENLSLALIKLNKNHLSKLFPHPWYVFVHYSHPGLIQRLKALNFDFNQEQIQKHPNQG